MKLLFSKIYVNEIFREVLNIFEKAFADEILSRRLQHFCPQKKKEESMFCTRSSVQIKTRLGTLLKFKK